LFKCVKNLAKKNISLLVEQEMKIELSLGWVFEWVFNGFILGICPNVSTSGATQTTVCKHPCTDSFNTHLVAWRSSNAFHPI